MKKLYYHYREDISQVFNKKVKLEDFTFTAEFVKDENGKFTNAKSGKQVFVGDDVSLYANATPTVYKVEFVDEVTSAKTSETLVSDDGYVFNYMIALAGESNVWNLVNEFGKIQNGYSYYDFDCDTDIKNISYEIPSSKNNWSKFWETLFLGKSVELVSESISPIVSIDSDVVSSDDFSSKYFVNHNDVSDVKNYNFANEWFNTVKRKQLKDNTFKNLNNKFKNYVLSFVDGKNIKSLTPLIFQKYFDELSEKCPRTLEDIKSLFNQIFVYAIASRITDINPITAVYTQKHQRTKGKAMNEQEEATFLNLIKNTNYELAFLIFLYSGCRPTEEKTLEFDFDNELIIIQNAKLKSYQTNKIRTLPMFPTIKRLKARILTEEWKFNDFVLQRKIANLKIGFTLKDLRHTFATKCKEVFEIPNEIVNLWQGHELGQDQTAKTYTHYSIEYQRKFAEKITH